MKINIFILLLLICSFANSENQDFQIQDKAVKKLMDLTSTYSDLSSFKCKAEINSPDGDFEANISIKRPNLFKVIINGNTKSIFFSNGELAYYYLPKDNAFYKYKCPVNFNEMNTLKRYHGLQEIWSIFPVFYQLLGKYPYPQVMKDVKSLTLQETDDTSNFNLLHLKRNDNSEFTLFIDKKKNLLSKITVSYEEIEVTFNYSNYILNKLDKNDLKFKIPEDSIDFLDKQIEIINKDIEKSISEFNNFFDAENFEEYLKNYFPESIIQASKKRGFLEKDLRKNILQFYQRNFNTALKQAADSIQYNEIKEFVNQFPDFLLKRPDTETVRKMIKDGERLIANGCQTPLVYLCLGLAQRRFGFNKKAKKYFLIALEKSIEVKDPKIIPAIASYSLAECLFRLNNNNKDEINSFRHKSMSLFVDALLDGSFLEGEERIFYYVVSRGAITWTSIISGECGLTINDDIGEYQEFAEFINKKLAPNNWYSLIFNGLANIGRAWKERGNGYANTVSEKGWSGFSKHLRLANDQLTKAWNLNKNLPEAPLNMITVAMAGYSEESEDVWFKRAINIQFDHRRAYRKYIWASRPRWGGSLEKMFAIGYEAFLTKRFDTNVPLFLLKVIEDIGDDLGIDSDIFKYKNVYKLLTSLFEGYLNYYQTTNTVDNDGKFEKSYIAYLAWLNEDFDKARSLFDELEGQPITSMYSNNHNELLVMGEIYAKTGNNRNEIYKINSLLSENKNKEAVNLINEVKKQATDFTVKHYLNSLLNNISIEEKVKKDIWIDFLPKENMKNFDASGTWNIGNNSITATVSKGLAILNYKIKLQKNFELKGKFQPMFKSKDSWTFFGLPYEKASLRFETSKNLLYFGGYENHNCLVKKVNIYHKNSIYLQVWENRFTLIFNGQKIWENELFDPQWEWYRNFTGDIYISAKNQELIYDDLILENFQIRYPSKKPDINVNTKADEKTNKTILKKTDKPKRKNHKNLQNELDKQIKREKLLFAGLIISVLFFIYLRIRNKKNIKKSKP